MTTNDFNEYKTRMIKNYNKKNGNLTVVNSDYITLNAFDFTKTLFFIASGFKNVLYMEEEKSFTYAWALMNNLQKSINAKGESLILSNAKIPFDKTNVEYFFNNCKFFAEKIINEVD